MPLPILKLNLAPPPTLWRRYHVMIAWGMLAVGALALAGALLATVLAYRQAAIAGQKVVDLTSRRRDASRKQTTIQTQLESIDVEKELPRWRLAERILAERGVPWSRLAVELERSLVQDVRLKSITRTRDSSQKVELKIKGEARNRAAEDAFFESLQKNTFFTQVIMEREGEVQGGGLEFDCVLPAASMPPAYKALPKYGPVRAANIAPPPAPIPQRPAPQRPMPQRMAPAAGRPAQNAPSSAPISRPSPIRMAPGTPAPSPTFRPTMPPIRRQFPSSAPPQDGLR
jgi:hypothetical protein